MIVEVLSPATERADRHEKLRVYQQINSLREYVIVAQNKILIEICRQSLSGDWTKEIYNEPDETFELKSVEVAFTVAEIYRAVDFGNEIQKI